MSHSASTEAECKQCSASCSRSQCSRPDLRPGPSRGWQPLTWHSVFSTKISRCHDYRSQTDASRRVVHDPRLQPAGKLPAEREAPELLLLSHRGVSRFGPRFVPDPIPSSFWQSLPIRSKSVRWIPRSRSVLVPSLALVHVAVCKTFSHRRR